MPPATSNALAMPMVVPKLLPTPIPQSVAKERVAPSDPNTRPRYRSSTALWSSELAPTLMPTIGPAVTRTRTEIRGKTGTFASTRKRTPATSKPITIMRADFILVPKSPSTSEPTTAPAPCAAASQPNCRALARNTLLTKGTCSTLMMPSTNSTTLSTAKRRLSMRSLRTRCTPYRHSCQTSAQAVAADPGVISATVLGTTGLPGA